MPPDDPLALIQVSKPEPGSLAAVEHVAPLFEEADFAGGAHLTLEPGRALIGRSELAGSERTVTVEVEVPDSGVALADLRSLLQPGEYLARAVAPSGIELVPGEDTLLHGDFEDYDVDTELGEAARWELAPVAAYVCQAEVWQGAGALCMPERAQTVHLHNRLRVPGHVGSSPNKDLSLVAYVRGENAGAIRFRVEFWSSEGSTAFGGATPIAVPAGSYDWQQVWADVHLPADPPGGHGWNSARALPLGIRHDWVEGSGLAAVDDVAVVAWRPGGRAASFDPGSINATEFLRVIGPPGRHSLSVTLRR